MIMQWYSVGEAASKYSRSIEWIRKQCRKGEKGIFPHAKRDGGWRIPQCCLEGHNGQSEGAGVTDVRQEIQRLNDNTDLYRAKRENTMARLGFDEVDDFEKARDKLTQDQGELEQVRQEIEKDKGLVARGKAEVKKAKQRLASNKFFRALKEYRDLMVDMRGWMKNDLVALIEYHNELKAKGYGRDMPEGKIELADEIYNGVYALDDILPDVPDIPDSSQFDEGEGEIEDEDEE